MGLSKIILLNAVLISLLLVGNVAAKTTFFDQDDAFIMADSTAEETTGVITSGGGCTYEWNCTNWSECLPSGNQTRQCTNIGTCNQGKSSVEIRECIPTTPALPSIPTAKPEIAPPENPAPAQTPSIAGSAISPAISLGTSLFSIIAILMVAALIGWKVLNKKYHLILIKKEKHQISANNVSSG